MDGEKSIGRKYKGITMAQWDNRLQNSSFGCGKPLFSVIFKALDQVQLGLTVGWQAGCLADEMRINL